MGFHQRVQHTSSLAVILLRFASHNPRFWRLRLSLSARTCLGLNVMKTTFNPRLNLASHGTGNWWNRGTCCGRTPFKRVSILPSGREAPTPSSETLIDGTDRHALAHTHTGTRAHSGRQHRMIDCYICNCSAAPLSLPHRVRQAARS